MEEKQQRFRLCSNSDVKKVIYAKKNVILSNIEKRVEQSNSLSIIEPDILHRFYNKQNMAFENDTNETNLSFSSTATLLITTIASLIFLASITGNSLIIAVVVRNVNMRKTVNLFVVNMAASDLLTNLSIPLHMANTLLGRWLFDQDSVTGLVLCKMTVTSTILSSGVSVGSLVAIALERFCAVFFSTKRPLLARRPFATITIIWVCYGTLASLLLVATRVLVKQDAVTCALVQESDFSKILACLLAIFCAGLPAIVILAIYPAILIRLWKRKLPGNPSTANQEIRDRTNRKVTYMVVTLMLAFVVSCFPYLGMTMKNVIARKSMLQNNRVSLFYFISLIFSLNSCTWNSFICIIFNNSFRNRFREILGRCFSCCCITSIKCFKKKHTGNLREHVREQAIKLADIQVVRMAALET